MPEIHEYAKMFPAASDDELADMAEDIKQRGLLCPIVMYEDKVIDGRNRLRACELAGVSPRFHQYTGTDPLGDVISWNLKRRHLSTSQKAAMAVTIKPMFEEQAKERQRAAGGDHKAVVADLPQADAGKKSRDQAAAAVGVSPRIVQDAEYVAKHSPELAEKVKAGEITVNAAKEEVKAKQVAIDEDIPMEVAEDNEPKKPSRIAFKMAHKAVGFLAKIPADDMEKDSAWQWLRGWIDEHE